jgi:hypothetical protein
MLFDELQRAAHETFAGDLSLTELDVITRDQTLALVALGDEASLEWRLVDPRDRKRRPFDKNALRAILTTK